MPRHGTIIAPMDDSAPKANTQNEVSLPSIFGIFLTLWFCILTQPYGSLFWEQSDSPRGRALLFFWRLDPLACASEAAITLVILARRCYRIIRRPDPQDSTSQRRPLFRDVLLTMSALFLCRVHTRRDGSTDLVVRVPIRRAASVGSPADSTTEMSSGSDALRMREAVIAVATLLAMCTVIIKLAALAVPSYVHVWAWLTVTGWLAVQGLLLAHHSDKPHITVLSERVESVSREFTQTMVQATRFVVCVGVSGYIGYLITYHREEFPVALTWYEMPTIKDFLVIFFFAYTNPELLGYSTLYSHSATP